METLIDARTVRIAGQTLRYALMGQADAERTLLLFNGIGASLETLQHFTRTRVLSFDVPGVGGSPAPHLPYRFSWLSRLAGRLLDHLGIGAVDVFGVSWGGALAQQFVHDHPERCRALVLAATSAGFVMVPGPLKALSKMTTPRRYTDPDDMRAVGPEVNGRILAGRLPDARLQIVDCGHLFILTQPQMTAATIEGFVLGKAAEVAA